MSVAKYISVHGAVGDYLRSKPNRSSLSSNKPKTIPVLIYLPHIQFSPSFYNSPPAPFPCCLLYNLPSLFPDLSLSAPFSPLLSTSPSPRFSLLPLLPLASAPPLVSPFSATGRAGIPDTLAAATGVQRRPGAEAEVRGRPAGSPRGGSRVEAIEVGHRGATLGRRPVMSFATRVKADNEKCRGEDDGW